MWNNVYGYKAHGFTHFIPDDARSDAKEAHQFAHDIGLPLNMRIIIDLPIGLSPDDQKKFYRNRVGRHRSISRYRKYECLIMLTRYCDPINSAHPVLEMLTYVPICLQQNYIDIVSRWEGTRIARIASQIETISRSGIIHSDFNDMFAATSDAFARANPHLPHMPSGPVIGQRSFYSRKLWEKHRIKFYYP